MLIGVFILTGVVLLLFTRFFRPVIKRMLLMTFILVGVGLVSAIVLKNFMIYKFKKTALEYVWNALPVFTERPALGMRKVG